MSSSPHSFRASVDILEELQLIAAQNLEKLDIDKYYEVVCELGKGTYGKVDLVVHKIRGEPQLAAGPPPVLRPSAALPADCVLCSVQATSLEERKSFSANAIVNNQSQKHSHLLISSDFGFSCWSGHTWTDCIFSRRIFENSKKKNQWRLFIDCLCSR